MIIKGKSRTNGVQLAQYLISLRDNDCMPEIWEMDGFIERNLVTALRNMSIEAEACNKRGGQQGLYHAQINPGEDITKEQFFRSVDLLEKKLGFAGQKRVVVMHIKEGRQHIHVVWSREKKGKFIPTSGNYHVHKQVSRELEKEFGHAPATGLVAKELNMENHKEILSDLWSKARDGREFVAQAREAGYTVAKGLERRPFKVVTPDGQSIDLVRQLKVKNELGEFAKNEKQQVLSIKTKEVSERLNPIRQELPIEAAALKNYRAQKQEREVLAHEKERRSYEEKLDLAREAGATFSDITKAQKQEVPAYEKERRSYEEKLDLAREAGTTFGDITKPQPQKENVMMNESYEQKVNVSFDTSELNKKEVAENLDDLFDRVESKQKKREIAKEEDPEEDIFKRLERKGNEREGMSW